MSNRLRASKLDSASSAVGEHPEPCAERGGMGHHKSHSFPSSTAWKYPRSAGRYQGLR